MFLSLRSSNSSQEGRNKLNSEARILVVDDEMGIREGCKRALSAVGYAVDEAEDGNGGFQKVKESPYDLILVDLMMPRMGGLDLIQKVHQIDPEIIIVVITGYATIETAVEATKRGAYDYLPKPFAPDALTALVKRGLEKRWLRIKAKELYAERDQKLLELANEQSRLRTIIGCMDDGVLVTNMEGRLVLWNASSVKMLKSRSNDVVGEALEYYIKNKTIVDSIREVLSSEDIDFSLISREVEVGDKGTTLMANVAPVRDEEGRILGAVTVLRDITTLKEIDKIKSQFVSMVAHELRAPLAAIEGWLELVLSEEAGEDEAQRKQWLGRAKDRAHSLLALVNDLLEINRMESGRIAQKMEKVHLDEIVGKIVDFLKTEADRRKISMKVILPKNFPPIQADIKDMEKLFTNLINNAIKYNSDNGSIFIEGEADKSFVCLRIRDTGIGISAQNISKIFEDFYRVEDSRTKKIAGTGLGLTIAKKIVDSHFGRIEVQSRLNEGSTFSVYLPRTKKISS
jgi:two-component system phosphate regulon sensor histidine kinase PhoR